MNYEDNSFKAKYKPERVLAVLGRRRATCSSLRLSLVEWDDHPNTLDLRIWYDGSDRMEDTPGKGIMFTEREGLMLFYGLLGYFRGQIGEVEQNMPRPTVPEEE